jgi:hypothetical protein
MGPCPEISKNVKDGFLNLHKSITGYAIAGSLKKEFHGVGCTALKLQNKNPVRRPIFF